MTCISGHLYVYDFYSGCGWDQIGLELNKLFDVPVYKKQKNNAEAIKKTLEREVIKYYAMCSQWKLTFLMFSV